MSNIFKSSEIRIGDERKIELKTIKEVDEKKEHQKEEIIKENIQKKLESKYTEKLKEAEEIAKKKIEQANLQAQMIIENAHNDAEEIHKEAKENGRKEGCSAGYTQGKQEADALIQEALEIKANMLQTKKELLENIEKDCVKLVIKTLEKILSQKINEPSEETILGLIKGAFDKCTYTESLILRVSEEDYEYVNSMKDKILALVENIDNIQIKKDASLSRGSYILDTVSGSIDSSIDTQFNRVKSIFEELLENE